MPKFGTFFFNCGPGHRKCKQTILVDSLGYIGVHSEDRVEFIEGLVLKEDHCLVTLDTFYAENLLPRALLIYKTDEYSIFGNQTKPWPYFL